MKTRIIEISKEVVTEVCISFPDDWTDDNMIAKLSSSSIVDELLKVDGLKWETYDGPFFSDCNETNNQNHKVDYTFL